MARPLRIEFPGAWYHVMNRGLGRRSIFDSDSDRLTFLELLGEITETFHVEVHAYSLMGNHYHLLIETPEGGLGRAMRHLNGIYTQKYNKKRHTDGPLFRGRYKALLVETDEYLLELVRYIHMNPVEAGLCDHPVNHRWTSHVAYMKAGQRPNWLRTDEVLSRFGRKETEAARQLNEFVCEGISKTFREELHQSGWALGSEGFKDWVLRNFGLEKAEKEIPIKEKNRPRLGVKRVLDEVSFVYNVPIAAMRKSQTGQRNEARSMAVYLARRLTGVPLNDLAVWMNGANGYTIAKMQQRFKERLGQERRLRKLATQLSHSILSNVKT